MAEGFNEQDSRILEQLKSSPTDKVAQGMIISNCLLKMQAVKTPQEHFFLIDWLYHYLDTYMTDPNSGFLKQKQDLEEEYKKKIMANRYSPDKYKVDESNLIYELMQKKFALVSKVIDAYGFNPNHETIFTEEETEDVGITPLINELNSVVNRDQRGVILFVSGKTGTGKSTFQIKTGFDFDSHFPEVWKERIFYRVSDFLEYITKTNLNYGSVVCLEEAGMNIHAYNWQGEVNAAFRDMAQIVRYKRLVLILNARSRAMIDNQTRQFIDYEIEAKAINREKNRNCVKIKKVTYVEAIKDFRNTFLKSKYGTKYREYWYIPPPHAVLEEYTKLSESWKTDKLVAVAENLRELENLNKPDDSESKHNKILEEAISDIEAKGIVSEVFKQIKATGRVRVANDYFLTRGVGFRPAEKMKALIRQRFKDLPIS